MQRLLDVIGCNGIVSVWDGDVLNLRDYETAALWFRAGLNLDEQERAVVRSLVGKLAGTSKRSAPNE